MTPTLQSLLTSLAALAVALATAVDDPDAPEIAPLEEFAQRENSVFHRYGPWTVQHITQVDPFLAKGYLYDTRRQRVNVFYESKPLWHSPWSWMAHIRFDDGTQALFGGLEDEVAGHWRLVPTPGPAVSQRTFSESGYWRAPDAFELEVVDITGGDQPTLTVTSFGTEQGPPVVNSTIQLCGGSVETARVEVLWTAPVSYSLNDVDDDGTPDVTLDFRTTWRPSNLAKYSTSATGLVMRWHSDTCAFQFAPRLAQDYYSNQNIDRDIREVEMTAAATLAGGPFPGYVGTWWRQLHKDLTDCVLRCLFAGQVEHALDLALATPFEHGETERLAWWADLHEQVTSFFLWNEVCGAFPALNDLPASLDDLQSPP